MRNGGSDSLLAQRYWLLLLILTVRISDPFILLQCVLTNFVMHLW